ncbi:speckle-type POZ protein B [Trichonephila clavipes]|uniref:Speckle-type POZ protein B n=1 Tax=Trichonephila clavipes TaxID=2585209 RepID=A0A8X7BBA6_TRICX|nr:speckle-type POZ protein B [Trichonephila clavipes]
MNIEKKNKRFYWKIENFGLYFLTQTEPLESPPFQITGIGPDVSFRLALHKETRRKDARVACFLTVSERSRAPATVKLDGTIILKMANETKKFLLQRAVVPKLAESTLLIETIAWPDTIFSKREFANYSISLLSSLWRSPLFRSRQCSAVTCVEQHIKKHVETLETPFPFSGIRFCKISEGSSKEFIWWYWARTRDKASHDPMLIPLGYRGHGIYLETKNKSNIFRIRKEMQLAFDDRRETIYCFDYFSSDLLDKKRPGLFKNASMVCSKIEAKITFYEEFGSTRKSNRKGCDLIFRCEKKDFPVHKSLPCCKSPVFSTMFENDMKEKKFGIVEMDDTDTLTLNRFIELLYLGTVTDSPINLDSTMALYKIAHKYSISDLIKYSRQSLVHNMDCGNRDEMLQFADLASNCSWRGKTSTYLTQFRSS